MALLAIHAVLNVTNQVVYLDARVVQHFYVVHGPPAPGMNPYILVTLSSVLRESDAFWCRNQQVDKTRTIKKSQRDAHTTSCWQLAATNITEVSRTAIMTTMIVENRHAITTCDMDNTIMVLITDYHSHDMMA